jgi:hypothetical protein
VQLPLIAPTEAPTDVMVAKGLQNHFTIFIGKDGRVFENVGTQYQVFVTTVLLSENIIIYNPDPIHSFGIT